MHLLTFHKLIVNLRYGFNKLTYSDIILLYLLTQIIYTYSWMNYSTFLIEIIDNPRVKKEVNFS